MAKSQGILKKKQECMKLAAIEFSKGEKIEFVMEKYNVSYASVYNALKKYNIPYTKTFGRTVFFDQDFFENIDTEEKAYWFGIIMADGNVGNTGASDDNRVTVAFSEKDEEHLKLFQKTVKHSGKFYIKQHENSFTNKKMYYLNLNSMKTASDVKKHGCLPRKTGNSSIPKLKKELIPHFIRGYFDGDGSLSVYDYVNKKKNGKEYHEVRGEFAITSDKNILLEIQNILMKECDLKKTKLKSYKRTEQAFSLRYGGKNQIQRIFNYLYRDATVYLQRKYNKFSLLLSQ